MTNPVPTTTVTTTMTPQQKVLYEKWSNYYNIRGYCSNKGTRYDLLQQQLSHKSAFYGSSYAPARATERASTKTTRQAKSVSCVASTADIPFESSSFQVGLGTCNNTVNVYSKEALECAKNYIVHAAIKSGDGVIKEIMKSTTVCDGRSKTTSQKDIDATASSVPKDSLQQSDTFNGRKHCGSPHHSENQNKNEVYKTKSVRHIENDDILAPEMLMMAHPYCVIPTTSTIQEESDHNGLIDGSTGIHEHNKSDDLIQFVLMRHRLQSTIDNSRLRNSDAATAKNRCSQANDQKEPPQKETDASTAATTTTTAQEDIVSPGRHPVFSTQASSSRYSDRSGSFNSEISTDELIQSVLKRHRLQLDAKTPSQEKYYSQRRQDIVSVAHLDEKSQVINARKTLPVARKDSIRSKESNSMKCISAGVGNRTSQNDCDDVTEIFYDTKSGTSRTCAINIDDDYRVATTTRYKNSRRNDDDFSNAKALNRKRIQRKEKHYTSEAAQSTSSKRKRTVATKCVYINAGRNSDHEHDCSSLLSGDNTATTRAKHLEMGVHKKFPSKRIAAANDEFDDFNSSSNIQTRIKNEISFSMNGNKSTEEANIVEAVLMLHRSKHGLCPATTDNFRHQSEVHSSGNFHHPSKHFTTGQAQTTVHGQANREHAMQGSYSPPTETKSLPQKQQFVSSGPILVTTDQLDQHVRQLAKNNTNNNDVSAPYGIPKHGHLHQSLTTMNTTGHQGSNQFSHAVGTTPLVGAGYSQGTSMVFHGIISSYPIHQIGPSATPLTQLPSMTQPHFATGLDHSSSKMGVSPLHLNDGTRDIDEQLRQKRRKKQLTNGNSSSPRLSSKPYREYLRAIKPVTSTTTGSTNGKQFLETDIGKLQQVNETWKQRYLALLRDDDEETNEGQL